jgi:hypothetical protein
MTITLIATPEPTDPVEPVVAPSRFNLAGFCQACLTYRCTDPDCVARWARLAWAVCCQCGGSGYEDYFESGPDLATVRCDWCTGGLVEVPAVDRGAAPGSRPVSAVAGEGRP